MTSATFKDWYLNCFIPTMKQYCAKKNIAFKILLLLDNAPSHPDLSNLCENVKIMFFPPNVTSLIQPMVCSSIELMIYKKPFLSLLLRCLKILKIFMKSPLNI